MKLAFAILCIAILAAVVSAPAGAQQSLASTPADLVSAVRDQHLTGRGIPASAQTFIWGGGTYRFARGRFWEIAGADGATLGHFFEGAGTLTWTAGDENPGRVYAENAKRVGGLSVAVNRSLETTFSRATFYFSPDARPRLAEAEMSGAPPSDNFRDHRSRFRPDRQMASELGVLAGRLNGTAFAEALLEGGKDIRHRVDGAAGFEETLSVSDRPSGTPSTFADWRFVAVIGSRPVGHARRTAPVSSVSLVDLAVDVRELEGGWGRFVVEETLTASGPVRAIVLKLRSDVLQGATYSAIATKFKSAEAEDGTPILSALDKNALLLVFPSALPPSGSRKVKFRYDAPFLGRPGGDNVWELSIDNAWYPQPLASRSAARHPFRSVVRARKPFLPFATGDVVRRGEDGDWNLLETRLAKPVPFATVLAGAYTVQEETQDGIVCRVASYGISKEKSGARLTNLFHKMRKFYEPYFGPFPWKEYTIVEVNSYGFGQAPPGMMRITREAFQANVIGDAFTAFFSGGINERLAHEIAHSWWGYGVWGATANDQWIEEAFSEVSAGRLIEEMKDKSDYTRLANIWRSRAKDSSSLAPIALANDLSHKVAFSDSSDLFVDRYTLTYFKGAVLLEAIRKEVGDDAFFTILKSFLRSFENKPAVTTDQFVGLLSFVTKRDWKPWFEKYYYGYDVP